MMSRQLLVLAIILGLWLSASAQSCTFGQRTFHSYEDIQNCLAQIPFSSELRKATLDNLRKTFSLYAFRDIVKNSPQSGSLTRIQTDLFAEFDRIEKATYTSDWVRSAPLRALAICDSIPSFLDRLC